MSTTSETTVFGGLRVTSSSYRSEFNYSRRNVTQKKKAAVIGQIFRFFTLC
jgi:hypothetical protein